MKERIDDMRDHFGILVRWRLDTHIKKKETLLIKDLKPSLNKNVCSEKLDLFLVCRLY